ncbi:MAG: nuclear transport factor 2 family protein [Thermoprotei archaeon]
MPPMDEANAVKRVVLALFEAARNKDFERLAELNDWDGEYTKFGDLPPLERLDGERAKHYDTVVYTNITDYTCVVEDLKVSVFGDVALATCYLRYGGILVNDYAFEARRFTRKSRATFVLRRKGDVGWVIVHQHISALSDEDAPLFDQA